MPNLDAEITRQLVQHFRVEAAAYQRQWTLSLGIGCGGAAIALISLAANLPDPNFAFRLFAPSLWIFLVGIASAAASLPVAALRSTNIGVHFSEAFNREQFQSATRAMPEFITAPKSLGEEMNAPRNKLIEKGNRAHDRAEKAWRMRDLWGVILTGLLGIAAAAFLVGVALPLAHISNGGLLAPSEKAHAAPVEAKQ
ncbi:hypothetical protein [Brevundimonas sp. UBA7534]|uniref:hypothetical protein n=1 Tax=Brevundimonas sp. UBA7534 TaxID=1946138 RepID=UPI0025BABF10|nr:hypothetical protein [Brevundimonas sp. UBA7534]